MTHSQRSLADLATEISARIMQMFWGTYPPEESKAYCNKVQTWMSIKEEKSGYSMMFSPMNKCFIKVQSKH